MLSRFPFADVYFGIGQVGPIDQELHEAEGHAVVALLGMIEAAGITEKLVYEGHGGPKNDLILAMRLRDLDGLRRLLKFADAGKVGTLFLGVPGMVARDIRVFQHGFSRGDWLTLPEFFEAVA